MEDGYRHKGLRKKLVEELRTKGIGDERVLGVLATIARHQFIDDSAFVNKAYEDVAFPIGNDQTISQPFTVAFQTSLLEVESGMRVLEIGTGSGYQTAVLFALGARVFSIERQRPLYLKTKERLRGMGIKANLYYGDGYLGLPKEAPFDRVLVTCGAPMVPKALLEQLRIGGKAVIPVGGLDMQTMTLIESLDHGKLISSDHGVFRFVPMMEQRAK